MNPVIARLALAGARSSAGRLAGIAGGVAIGVCLILLLWGAAQGLTDRDQRAAWLRTEGEPAATMAVEADGMTPAGDPEQIPLTADTVLLGRADDFFRDRLVQRRDIAAAGDSTVAIPGIAAAPEPGTYYASPALQQLIESTPADQLGDRYGTYAGTIDDSALAGPDSLVVITGATEEQLRQGQLVSLVTDFTTNPYGDNAATYRTLMALGGIAVLFPVLLLISTSTRLGAAQRTERFAVLRLIGAAPRTVAGVAAVETAVPSLLGAVLGAVIASLLRPGAARIPVNGNRFYAQDLVTGPISALLVIVLVVVAATAAAAWGTARAGIGPLGAARARPEPTPTAVRALPLAAGLVAMATAAALVGTETQWSYAIVDLLLVGGFALTAVGLVLIGPWLTLLVSRIGLARASSAAAVIAASRIRHTPVATFRAVSGLVVAVFMVSVFAGASSAVASATAPEDQPGVLASTSLVTTLETEDQPVPVAQLLEDLRGLTGVQDIAVGYATEALDTGMVVEIYFPRSAAPALGLDRVPADSMIAVDPEFLAPYNSGPLPSRSAPVEDLHGLVPVSVVVSTDGSFEAIDRARTTLNTSGVTAQPAGSRADATTSGTTRLVHGLAVLAYLGTFLAVTIAGISLAIATAGAIIDRRRALGLMRLMGMPVSALRGIIVREAAVPLLSVLLLSAGLGFFVAWLVVTGLSDDYSITWPSPTYFITLGLGMALALAAVAITFGLLRTHTSITTTRFA
ncbi:FtsX-like permease family protein [Kocuria sp. NPDC057446]|uniref:FtsX-like permease family protein n=1 Tax=Kocuria sp. NPDC057446 TaxID=3346137 RepID=UPI0036A0C32C